MHQKNIIPDNTKLHSIDLRVRDLEVSLEFYIYQLGFKVIDIKDNASFISADGKYPYLFKLIEDKSAPVRMKGTTGLYHIAILFPDRKELARVFLRLFHNKIKFQGFSDHLVSEAIYLADPDGNGIELYTDKPRESWIWKNGEVVMDSLPLDLSVITKEISDRDEWNGIHPEVMLGHIHLNVSDLRKAEEFFNEILRLNISNYSYPGAKFFSAGGYHHHIAANTWMTNKKISPNDKSLGLISYTLKLNDGDFLNQIKNNLSGSEFEIMEEKEGEITLKDADSIPVNIIS